MASLYNSGHTLSFVADDDYKSGDVIDFRTSGPIPFWGVVIRDVKDGEEGAARIDGAFMFETETRLNVGDRVSYVNGVVVAYNPADPEISVAPLGFVVEGTHNGFVVVKINTGICYQLPVATSDPAGPAA